MNTLTQLMQYFGYASAFAFVAPAIVLCSIARLGLTKGAPNIVPDIITHGLLSAPVCFFRSRSRV